MNSASVIRFPRTQEGRQALRDVLFCLRNCGPAPLDQRLADADWDQVAVDVSEFFAQEEKESRR